MQRFRDAEHPDFAHFHDCLRRGDLSGKARSTLLFALAKAYDDIGDYDRAAEHSRKKAIAIARSLDAVVASVTGRTKSKICEGRPDAPNA